MSDTEVRVALLAVFRGARALLTEPCRWTRRTYARLANGVPCHPLAEGAHCFCLQGAVIREAGNWLGAEAIIAMGLRCGGVASFNDATDHAGILRFLDSMIQEWETP